MNSLGVASLVVRAIERGQYKLVNCPESAPNHLISAFNFLLKEYDKNNNKPGFNNIYKANPNVWITNEHHSFIPETNVAFDAGCPGCKWCDENKD